MVLAAFVLASLSFSTPRIGRAPRMALDAGNPVALESDAAAMLEEANGDANKARMNFIGYTMAFIQEEQPDVYEALTKNPERPDCHEALVEITWDSIAAFLPVTHSPTPTPGAAKRLEAIARGLVDVGGESVSVLDVGCGNGLLLPFLSDAAAGQSAQLEYQGIDLSSRMISAAEAAYARDGADFTCASFAAACEGPRKYDAICFNGALQFFAEPGATIEQAAVKLSDAPGARVVVAHINGGAFVRSEKAENPATVLSEMPTFQELKEIASGAGLEVAPWDGMSWETMGDDAAAEVLDDFYFAVLRRPQQAQTTVKFEI